MPDKTRSPSRAERALVTRRRMIEAAAALFTDAGYAATTMDAIAERASVAVQTVYYSFGTKGRLLCEAMEFAAAGGHGAPTVIERGWIVEAFASSPYRALALAVEHGTDIYERAAPLWPAIEASVVSDPAVADYWAGVAAARRNGMARLLTHLAEQGALKPGLDIDRATDLMFVLNGHDTFRGFVAVAGWSVTEYKSWAYAALVRELLAPGPEDSSATTGLSFPG